MKNFLNITDLIIETNNDGNALISKCTNFVKLTNGKAASIKNMENLKIGVNLETGVLTMPDGVRSFDSDGKVFFTNKADTGNTVEF